MAPLLAYTVVGFVEVLDIGSVCVHTPHNFDKEGGRGSLPLAIEWIGSRIMVRTPTNETISELSSHKPGRRIHTLARS